MDSAISVTPRPYWVSTWLLRPMARPFVVIDGAEYPARWGADLTVAVSEGPHSVGVGMRYRGFKALLGVREKKVDLRGGFPVRLNACNGLFNSEPFYLTAAR